MTQDWNVPTIDQMVGGQLEYNGGGDLLYIYNSQGLCYNYYLSESTQ